MKISFLPYWYTEGQIQTKDYRYTYPLSPMPAFYSLFPGQYNPCAKSSLFDQVL